MDTRLSRCVVWGGRDGVAGPSFVLVGGSCLSGDDVGLVPHTICCPPISLSICLSAACPVRVRVRVCIQSMIGRFEPRE